MGRGSKGPKRSSQPLLSSRIGLISLSPHTVIKGFKCPHLSDLSKQYYQGAGTPGLCTQSISPQHSSTLSWLPRAAVPRHSLPCRPLRCQSEGPGESKVPLKTAHWEVHKSSATQSKPTPQVSWDREAVTSPRHEPFLWELVWAQNAEQGAFMCLV